MTATMGDEWAYMKPTRYVHDSGYRMFEVGYLHLGDNLRIASKRVLGHCDHITTDYKAMAVNMDMTKDGYIRFFSRQGQIVWDNDTFATSTMSLELRDTSTEGAA